MRWYWKVPLLILLFIVFTFILLQISTGDSSFIGIIITGIVFALITFYSYKYINLLKIRLKRYYLSSKKLFYLSIVLTLVPVVYVLLFPLLIYLIILVGLLFFNGSIVYNSSPLVGYLIFLIPSLVGFFFVNYFSLKEYILDNRKPIISLKKGLVVGIIVAPITAILISLLLIIGVSGATFAIFGFALAVLFGFIFAIITFVLTFVSSFITWYLVGHLKEE